MGADTFIRGIQAFQSLTLEQARQLSTQCRDERFPAGTRIIRKGDPGDAMFIIRSGHVRIPVVGEDGLEKFITRLGPNEFFGEIALLTGEPRTSDVWAEEEVVCMVIAREPLQEFLAAHPRVASFLTEILGQRLLSNNAIRLVGKYRVLEELGRGGMSIVYEGVHPGLSRTVAVKMLSHSLVYDPRFTEQFRNEAKIIANLEHENIIRVFDAEEAYCTYFIIMEKVEGRMLAELIDDEGPPPFDRTRAILRQLASALDYAHGRGIVHRDIKPSNVALDRDGNVKLMDFGIAKREREPDLDERTVGTPAYMSPEHARGDKVDGRADIYSLGVVAYEMLTGKLPVTGVKTGTPTVAAKSEAVQALLDRGKDPVPSPRTVNPKVPDDLELLVVRATRADPDERFRTAREIVDMLEPPEQKRVGLDHVRARSVTVVYEPSQEERVTRILDQVQHAASRLPGVKVFRS